MIVHGKLIVTSYLKLIKLDASIDFGCFIKEYSRTFSVAPKSFTQEMQYHLDLGQPGVFMGCFKERPFCLFSLNLRTPEVGVIRILNFTSENAKRQYGPFCIARALEEFAACGARKATIFIDCEDKILGQILRAFRFQTHSKSITFSLKLQDLRLPKGSSTSGLNSVETLLASQRHLRAIHNIYKKVFAPELSHSKNEIHAFYDNYKDCCRIATKNNRVVGAVIAEIKEPKMGRIHGLAVLPEYQRMGIGSALLGAAVQDLKVKSASCISATIEGENEASIALFSKFGFKPSRELILMIRA